MSYEEQRQLELQWLEKYSIEDTDEAIALKALDLLKPALKNNPWSPETEKILDILLEKLKKLETSEQVMCRSVIYIKAYDALLIFEVDDYLDYMIREYDSWADEIRSGIEDRNNEYIQNGQNYVSGISLTIYSVLRSRNKIYG